MASPAVRLATTIDGVDADAWDAVRAAAGGGVALDRRFIAATERTLRPGSRIWHAVVEADGEALACTSFTTYDMDLAPLAGDGARRVGQALRRFVPSALKSRMLFCGLPTFFGLSHLGLRSPADGARVVPVLVATARELAATTKADFVVFREFDAAGRRAVAGLTEFGYAPIEMPAMYHFEPRGRTFDEYCASLRGRYRHEQRRIWKKLEQAGFTHRRLLDPDEIARAFTDEVYALYVRVAEGAEFNIGHLTPTFLPELARQMPGQVALSLIERDGRVWGCSAVLASGPKVHFLFCGFERERNKEGELYFNIMYRDLAYAMSVPGVEDIEVGQTGDFFKARLGCEPVPRSIFLRAMRPLPAFVLRVGLSRFLAGGYHESPASNRIYRSESSGMG